MRPCAPTAGISDSPVIVEYCRTSSRAVIRRNDALAKVNVSGTAAYLTVSCKVNNSKITACIDLQNAHLILRSARIRIVIAALEGLSVKVYGYICARLNDKLSFGILVTDLLIVAAVNTLAAGAGSLFTHTDIVLVVGINNKAVVEIINCHSVENRVDIVDIERRTGLSKQPVDIIPILILTL